MLAWSRLLVQKIDLQVGGLRVRKLQVNRHHVAAVQAHAHEWSQAILFLTAEGTQQIGDQQFPARPGDLFLVPARRLHGFAPSGRDRPMCLVLDFDRPANAGSAPGRLVHRRLEPAALNALHSLVSQLPRKGRLRLGDYATVVAIAALLFQTPAPGAAMAATARAETLLERVRRFLLDAETSGLPLTEIARRCGYQPDYLTRKLRQETGRGLRELRDSLRLEAATQALRGGAPVAEATQHAGFGDPAYFARWFRRRLGLAPREYRRRHPTAP